MNAKKHPKTIQKSKLERANAANSVQKQASSLRERNPVKNKIVQKTKSIPSLLSLNTAIQHIQNLTLLIKDISIAPFIQKSLITSLNLYSQHLNKYLNTSIQANSRQSVKTSIKSEESQICKDKSFSHGRILLTRETNSAAIMTQKSKGKQKQPLPLKSKLNTSKFILPQIGKQHSKDDLQPVSTIEKNQIETGQMYSQQKENVLTNRIKDGKSPNKTPKSRFYELKINPVQYDAIQQRNGDQENQLKTLENRLNPFSRSKKDLQKYEEIVDGLKKRLGQHMKLIGRLQLKIKEFEYKKLGDHGAKVFKNQIQPDSSKSNQIPFESITQIRHNQQQDSKQISILKQQLHQRQQELKALWILLQQHQSSPLC